MQPRLAQDSLYTGLTLNMTFLCLSVPSDGITGMHHHSSPTWRASFLPSLLLSLPPHSVPLLSVFLQSIMMEEEPRTITCNAADVLFPKMLICKIEKIGELEVALMYQFPKCCCNKSPQIAQSETPQISSLHFWKPEVSYQGNSRVAFPPQVSGDVLEGWDAFLPMLLQLSSCFCVVFLTHDYIITSVSIVMWSLFYVPPYLHFPPCEFIYFLFSVTKYQTKAT